MPRSRKKSRKGPGSPTSGAQPLRGRVLSSSQSSAKLWERACVVCGKKGLPTNSFANALDARAASLVPINDEGSKFACPGCAEAGMDLLEGPDAEA